MSLINVTSADDKCDKYSDLSDKEACVAGQIQNVTKDIASVQKDLKSVSDRIKQYGSQLTVTQTEINQLNADIKKIEDQLKEIGKKLEDRKAKLADKINLRNYLVRNYLKRTQLNAVELFFAHSINNLGLSGFEFSYLSQGLNKAASDETIKLIQGLNADIHGFEKDKADAEDVQKSLLAEQNKLLAMKADLDTKAAQAKKEETDLNKKEASLSQRLAELNAKQQEILNEKNGDQNGSVGDYTPPAASTPSPPFKPAFAAFSYGAYTHYNGMSQYGARGRAQAKQSYEEILKFYYKVGLTDMPDKDDDQKIKVSGYGEMSFQNYLYGLAEMPSDWPDAALKAQAVAGRTYAYNYAKQGKTICTTESCQVFLKSKSDHPPDKWKAAVDGTSGKILKDSKTSQYSSTTGGYINNVGWDGSWPDGSYEKKGGSPWFYRAWYTKGYSTSDSCGHSHPWLSEKEMADILNAWVVWRKGSSGDKSHITPTTTSCWGGDPYSLDEMADKADKYGEKYSSVSSVDVDISSGGYTSKVTLGTNKGTITISGEEFKTVYNLRAPGYVSIKSRLFDLEKRN